MEKLKITWISNIQFEPYLRSCIVDVFAPLSLTPYTTYISFNEYSEKIMEISDSDYIVVCLNLDEIYPNLINNLISNAVSEDAIISDIVAKCQSFYNAIRCYTLTPIIWIGFEDYCYHIDYIDGQIPILEFLTDRLNINVFQMFNGQDVYIDLKHLIARNGINRSYNLKGKFRWNSPYSKELILLMVQELYKQYLIYIGRTKKCIVIDCDNVLWGGILLEDGIEGIQLGSYGLGRQYQDFQRFLLTMYYQGVILAVCSKNDEPDVLKVFREHSEMILKKEYISCFQCNWDNKPDNIQKIAYTLNIGIDSMIFVDDSKSEIEAVKSMLPNIEAFQYDCNTIYEQFSCFNLNSKSDLTNIKKRTETYRTNIQREKLKSDFISSDEYLMLLHTKIDIHKSLSIEMSRISELTQRTNKFTNGIRYTVNQLKEKINRFGYVLYTVSVSDRFSDLGVVGVIGIYENKLDLFSLSCRAMGRHVEDVMINHIKQCNIKTCTFVSTGKNDMLYEKFKNYFNFN